MSSNEVKKNWAGQKMKEISESRRWCSPLSRVMALALNSVRSTVSSFERKNLHKWPFLTWFRSSSPFRRSVSTWRKRPNTKLGLKPSWMTRAPKCQTSSNEQTTCLMKCGGRYAYYNSMLVVSIELVKFHVYIFQKAQWPQTNMHTVSDIIFGHSFLCSATWCDPFCSMC